jgi:hypothetical protein
LPLLVLVLVLVLVLAVMPVLHQRWPKLAAALRQSLLRQSRTAVLLLNVPLLALLLMAVLLRQS